MAKSTRRVKHKSRRVDGDPSHNVAASTSASVHRHQRQVFPFESRDNVLLVGGDFSFASSLARHHRDRFKNLLATVYESREELFSKFQRAEQNINSLLGDPGPHADSSMGPIPPAETAVRSQADTIAEVSTPEPDEDGSTEGWVKILYRVDATRLSRAKAIRNQTWDRIVFNFPHVGGKTTDVRRQVRHNQELLVGFFDSARPLLRDADVNAVSPPSILVTLFEGEPYTLWNVRDLARHAGLTVRRSWRFASETYPGYRHSRTFGDIVRKGKGDSSGAGAWKGEERPARTFEFGLASHATPPNKGQPRKRKRADSTDEDD